jgi:hypothetical protein
MAAARPGSTFGNLGGNAQHTRHTFNNAFIRAFAADFHREGARTIARLRRESPVNYVKIAAPAVRTAGAEPALWPLYPSVRVAGDLKMPQPSNQQLQVDTTSQSNELPFTSYTIFKTVNYGSGVVESGWSYDLSDTMRPKFQHCQYRQSLDKGVAGKFALAVNGFPLRPSSLARLSFNFDEALANCIWVSGT